MDTPEADIRWGKYQILHRLEDDAGVESFRAVLRGPEGFSRACVLKRFPPDPRRVEQALCAARLQHPAILQAFDFGKADNAYFVAVDLVGGVSLPKVLEASARAGVPPGPLFAVQLGLRLASALSALEAEPALAMPAFGFGLTAANVVFTHGGDPKLSSFTSRLPEQSSSGESPETARIASLAALLRQVTTGTPPIGPIHPSLAALLDNPSPSARDFQVALLRLLKGLGGTVRMGTLRAHLQRVMPRMSSGVVVNLEAPVIPPANPLEELEISVDDVPTAALPAKRRSLLVSVALAGLVAMALLLAGGLLGRRYAAVVDRRAPAPGRHDAAEPYRSAGLSALEGGDFAAAKLAFARAAAADPNGDGAELGRVADVLLSGAAAPDGGR